MPRKKPDQISSKLNALHLTGQKAVALLIDPEKIADKRSFEALINMAAGKAVDFFFVGGSLLTAQNIHQLIAFIKSTCPEIPVVLFPGNVIQINEDADGILFLSLISGRNPELLIGQQVTAAPILAKSNLEILPTGYMLVNNGEITSVNYISQTIPIPNNKPALAVATALAGKFLGLKYLFLDAGSGANSPVNKTIIAQVKEHTACPLIVGGGINSVEKAKNAWNAGADLIVLGNGIEKNPGLLTEVLDYVHVYNLSLNVN
ncbi:geranylgeranylglyceryl/heptaprenylglyceryl phosphate synthase [Echinicola marina]|uniref:geranylgeranylglyceryl/heptaprenylglyceryl phosphate synthase n=1 Tax=Echinicola marina TaxID=2859768 RepID=UPI001CF707A9|nr:geranylgeranylglyceryl/heptaprenylglyceryl phosphate synthase [Echinicola marina]UCS94493.1 geranylgeranylglyceryl/heptaprenylglyceryl phosphate synthase [Echinicola marina]